LLLVGISGTCSSQSLVCPEHALGVKGGVTLSFMRFDPAVSLGSMPVGASVGLQYRMILEKYFGLWIELNYQQRGFQIAEDNQRRQWDYIELPILAHFTFGKKMFRFYFNLGPEISVMVKDYGGALEQYPVANRFDYGLTGGIGFELNTRAGIYTLGGRYSFGMGNVFKNDRDPFYVSGNQTIEVTFGWMWKFKHHDRINNTSNKQKIELL